jgi:heme A synthase
VVVHQRLANAILLLGLVGTVWALENVLRRRVSPALRAYLRLTFLAIVLQGVVGIVLVATGNRPTDGLHWFYGPAALLSLPVAWSLSAGADQRREALALLGGSLAVFLFALRAIGTGG